MYYENNYFVTTVQIDWSNTGVVGRMAARPVVLPESFNGDGSWTDWHDHFVNVATRQ